MRSVLLALLLTVPALAQYRASAITLVAAHGFDAASSRGGVEANPVLGRGQFGVQQVTVKSCIVAGALAGQYLIIRREPRAKKWLTIANYAAAGALVVVGVRNWRVK